MADKNRINATALSLETLPLVEAGGVAKQFDELLAQMVQDCEGRHFLDKDRVVTLKVLLKPVCTDSGILDHVDVDFDLGAKGPGFSTGAMPMLPRQGNRLLFQPLSPNDPHQDPLPNIDKETGEVIE